MKFDVVEPSDEQAIVDEEEREGERALEEELRLSIHPGIVRASARMRTRVRDDLATLHTTMGSLNEHIQIAQHRELPETTDAAPPVNFRAGAFSRSGDS